MPRLPRKDWGCLVKCVTQEHSSKPIDFFPHSPFCAKRHVNIIVEAVGMSRQGY